MKKALSYVPATVLCLFFAALVGCQLASYYAAATPIVRSERIAGTLQGFHQGRRAPFHQSRDILHQRSSFSLTYIVSLGVDGAVFVQDEALHPIGSPIELVRKTHINGWVEYDVAGR